MTPRDGDLSAPVVPRVDSVLEADQIPSAATNSPARRDDWQAMGVGAALLTLLLALLWGGTSVTARIAADRVPPLAVGGIRFGLAAIFMLAWCRWEGVSLKLTRPQVIPALVLGLLLFLQIGTFNLGVAWSTASHSTLLVNTYVFWVAIADHFLTRQARLSAAQWVGLGISALGAALLFVDAPAPANKPGAILGGIPRDEATLAGDLTLVISAILFAVKVLYTKRVVRSHSPGTLIFWHDVIGTLLFLVASLAWERAMWHDDPWTPGIVASLLYSGLVVSGFCFAAQAWQLRQYGASQVSVFSFATPVFGVGLAILFRGDRLSGWLLLAGVLVAIGIVLVNRGGIGRPEAGE
jgi:drug/metabolite transporter (DMT)-like permease